MTDFSSNQTEGTFSTFDELAEPLRQGRLGEFQAKSDLASCLLPLLHAVGWRRDLREISEALPHFADQLTLQEFRNVLARLGFKTERLVADLDDIDDRLMPCLYISDVSGASVLIKRTNDGIKVFDGYANMERVIDPTGVTGTLYVLTPVSEMESEIKELEENWGKEILRRFRWPITQMTAATAILNILALSVPLFVMSIYDKVIPTASYKTLGYLVLAMGFVFLVDWLLRTIRSRMIAYMGGRVENIVATATFRKIMSLPANLVETAPLGSQVARLKEFDILREVFVGPLLTVVLETPFTLLFVVAIAILGGWLAIIPVVMAACYALIAMLLLPRLKRAVKRAGVARAKRHGFLVETVSDIRTIKEARAEDRWLERYREISSESSYLQFQAAQISQLFQSLGQAVMMLSGLAVIIFGVIKVLDSSMSVGALIAVMALVWRTLAPIQSFFLYFSRYEQIKVSLEQLSKLISLADERPNLLRKEKSIRRNLGGAIALERVSFRYSPTSEPALLGFATSINSGEMLAITGANGSGKTTILRMILGLNQPQAGQVTMDGMDIRQIDPIELRQTVAYVPQGISFFHGTIAQNLRLANPVASDEELKDALSMAGALDDVMAMPNGIHSRIGDQVTGRINSGLQQRLALARAYVKKAPILLLDESAQGLDDAGDEAFVKAIKKLKGNTTIIMVSHRPSHIRLADRVLVMVNGALGLEGKPEDVLARLVGGRS